MKMKEVCAATGLSERAVRFYVQEKLLCPTARPRGGRTWLDFSGEDVERLRTIATLRRAGFTLEEIRAMQSDFAANAPRAAFALRRRLREASGAYERLCRADGAGAGSPEELARRLREDVAARPLPPEDRAPPWRPWAKWLEGLCMLLAALAGGRLYLFLIRPLDELLFSMGMGALSVLAVPMLYLAVALPLCLLLGSRLGKWLGRHLDF